MNRIFFAWIIFFLFLFGSSCSENDYHLKPEPISQTMYFPPINSDRWENVQPEDLGWDPSKISPLLTFLEENHTRVFILLKNGRMVMEEYFGNNLLGTPFQASDVWYWASTGKTLTATLTGIALDEHYLQLSDPVSNYLGNGWTDLTILQEENITIRHQLTMTSGLDDGVPDNHCTDPECLVYLADPGTRWAYHNAPYTLLDKVIENATGVGFDDFFNTWLRDPIGMDGFWTYVDYDHVYFSTARSMARFGILMLAEGKWEDTWILRDGRYFNEMINTSQDLNQSYGYLWWLNGKTSLMVPGIQTVIPISLTPNAPGDMYAAMGKNGQILNIVPSQGIVMVRMGDNPDNSLIPVNFQNDLWERLNRLISDR